MEKKGRERKKENKCKRKRMNLKLHLVNSNFVNCDNGKASQLLQSNKYIFLNISMTVFVSNRY